MVFVGGVVCECMKVVFRKERVDLVCLVLCVYNYRGFSFVRMGNHGISLRNFLSYLFKHLKLSLVYGIPNPQHDHASRIQNLHQCTRLHTGSSEPQPQHLGK